MMATLWHNWLHYEQVVDFEVIVNIKLESLFEITDPCFITCLYNLCSVFQVTINNF